MRLVVVSVLCLALGSGYSPTHAAHEEALPAGAFSPAGAFHDFTRGEHQPVLLADGRVLILPVGARGAEVWDPETFAFSPAGALPKERYGYSATLLVDGRVLVVGGSGRSRRLADAKTWDPATESFSPAGNLDTARDGHDAVLLPDGRVLVLGGCCDGDGESVTSAEVWDPAKRRFGPAGSMRGPRAHHTVTLLQDGRVLVVGGWGSDASGSTAEIWDPSTDAFGAAGTMAQERAWHQSVLLADGRVLVLGGGSAMAELWDPATMKFTPAGSLMHDRDGLSATLLQDGRLLVVGGEGTCDEETLECESLTSAEVWDPVTMSFSPAGELAQGRIGHSATLLPDGRVLVFGGSGSEDWTMPSTAEVWDPATSTFSPAGAFGRVRLDYGHVPLPDGRVLVTGGSDGMAHANDALIWDASLFEPGPPVSAPLMDQVAAEARLLAGVRASLREACKPLRAGLPEEAVAGLDCPLGDPVVKRVRAYLFREQTDLLDAYFARLARAGLDRQASHRGRCEPGRPAEGPYHPTLPRDRDAYPFRDACFFDSSGRAHYLSTSPPHVLSEVVGRSDDFDAVRNWAWAGGGGDVPGGPRVAG